MTLDTKRASHDTTRIALEPPTFSPPREMREEYLAARKNELDVLLFQAQENDWRTVMLTINHVRGSGAMYGFEAAGNAAEEVSKAVQNGDAKLSRAAMEAYADAVRNAAL